MCVEIIEDGKLGIPRKRSGIISKMLFNVLTHEHNNETTKKIGSRPSLYRLLTTRLDMMACQLEAMQLRVFIYYSSYIYLFI
jgi:hypothetical protein